MIFTCKKEMEYMNKEYFTYRSKFAPYIEGLLREKEQKGRLNGTMFKCYMPEFDRFFREYNIEDLHIKKDTIATWRATRTNDNERNLYHKYIAWVHLCRYMCGIGIECHIPMTPKKGRQNDYVPYIYTHKEIQILFLTCDRLRIIRNKNLTPLFVMPALCRLLYSTGIRIGEALAIKNEDIDFENRIIYINKSKNGQQRLAAINETLLPVLKQYEEFRNKIPVNGIRLPDCPFFVTQLGKPCLYGNIRDWFSRILYFGEIPKRACPNLPRIHDLRHTATVHAMEKLVRSGKDIYCALPLISVFLGHKNIISTESYVRLTHEMFPDLIRMEDITSHVFPQIQYAKLEDIYDGFC
jgi:integrase